MLTRTSLFAALLLGFSLLPGCAKKTDKDKPPPPEVIFIHPTLRDITEIEEFTGYTRAVKTVEVRARVTGYLDKVHFKDGTTVHEGELLYSIDPRTYKAEVDKTEALFKQSESALERLSSDLRRGRTLASGRAISSEELERLNSSRNEAESANRAARAMVETARLNLSFTRVVSPLSGRISRNMIDPGNLVKADDTLLTNVVTLDPIHAYFDVDERTELRLRRLVQNKMIDQMVRDKKDDTSESPRLEVKVGLADEEGFSRTGIIDFTDNQLDHGTGTLRVRAEIPNHAINGTHTLSPGMFVRIQLPIGRPQPSLLVPEEALGSDQGNKFLLIVKPVKLDDLPSGDRADIEKLYLDPIRLAGLGRIEERRVTVGQQEKSEGVPGPVMRVIKPFKSLTSVVIPELQKDERIIVSGHQRVRAGRLAIALTKEQMDEVIAQRKKDKEAKPVH